MAVDGSTYCNFLCVVQFLGEHKFFTALSRCCVLCIVTSSCCADTVNSILSYITSGELTHHCHFVQIHMQIMCKICSTGYLGILHSAMAFQVDFHQASLHGSSDSLNIPWATLTFDTSPLFTNTMASFQMSDEVCG